MGILKRLFGKKTNSNLQKNSSGFQEKELIKDYEDLVEKTEALKKENLAWETEFNSIVELRRSAQQLEKENKLQEAISVYLKSILAGEKSQKLNICNYAHDIGRVIILFSKTKQKDELKNFLKEKIDLHPNFKETKKWIVRLSKLNNEDRITEISISPTEINEQKASTNTIGQRINDYKREMPEFNFYYDLPANSSTLSYNNNVSFEYFKKLREFREAFETIKSLAKIAENEGDYKKAIEAYKKMIAEEFEGPEPYERLIIIYAKLKWKDEEKRAIEQAISFFIKLRDKQLNYVLKLAKKYNMTEKAMEYIDQNQKIFYYNGAFELYNPQTSRLTKWKKRLEKLNN